VTALLLAVALAHESGVSSSRLEMRGGEIRATFTFSLEDLAGLARLDADRNGLIEPAEWTQVLPAIAAYVGDHFRIEACRSEGDAELVPGAVRVGDLRTPITLALRYLPARPLDRLKIRCDLFREHGGSPRHIAEFPGGETVIFDNDRRQGERPTARAGLSKWWIAGLIPALLAAGLQIRKRS
jgi:hypothetical protein